MVVGIDVSSRRIDLAWLDISGIPRRWHQEMRGDHLIDRLRDIRVSWPERGYYAKGDRVIWEHHDVTDIAIEYPYAVQKNAIAALMATVGVITRQAPTWARVAWPSSGELRKAIGAKNTKADAHARIRGACAHVVTVDGDGHTNCLTDWDEHELDALVACIGWTRILEQQDTE